MTRYAEVAVDASVGHSRTFSYSIPDRFRLEPGQLVWVPFGRRILQGLVIELTAAPSFEKTKDILQPVDPGRLLDDTAIALAQWLSRYYLCSLFQAIALFLPPGFKAQVRSQILPLPGDAVNRGETEGRRPWRPSAPWPTGGGMNEVDFAKLLGRPGIREVNRLVGPGLRAPGALTCPGLALSGMTPCFFPAGNPDSLGNWPEAAARVFAEARKPFAGGTGTGRGLFHHRSQSGVRRRRGRCAGGEGAADAGMGATGKPRG